MKKIFILLIGLLCTTCVIAESKSDISIDKNLEKTSQISHSQAKVSWYSVKCNGGTKTASGVKFKDNSNYIAHKHLPFGTLVEFIHPKTGKKATGKVVDRGPYKKGREFDLSKGLAKELGFLNSGVVNLKYRILGK